MLNEPTPSALPCDQPTTTKEGKPRQRLRWTIEMNEDVIRCYYTATKLETENIGYRPQLLQLFKEKYPAYTSITEQRLMDQKRVITTNNKIPQGRLEVIKQEVAIQINAQIPNPQTTQRATRGTEEEHANNDETFRDNAHQQEETQIEIGTIIQPQQNLALQQHEANTEPIIERQHIRDIYSETYANYEGTDPLSRPYIPKPTHFKKIATTIFEINNIIQEKIRENDTCTLVDINLYIYCGAVTATRIHSIQRKEATSKKCKNNFPPWQKRLENKISKLRTDIGQLTQHLKGQLSQKKLNNIFKNNILPTNCTNQEIINSLDRKKQTLQAMSKRLRRYKKSHQRREQNQTFNTNQKQFYRQLEQNSPDITNPPTTDCIQKFWSNIWSNNTEHNRNATWISNELKLQEQIEPMTIIHITLKDIKDALQSTHNWKSAGDDKIQNFWLKKFTSTHQTFAILFNKIIQDPETMPDYLMQGVTYLKPKDEDTTNPAKYRPITCLSTTYKLVTSIITQKLDKHLEKIMAEEQKGCRKGARGCKEQLIIDAEIHKQAKDKQRALYYGYIDYQKAFDSVPHSWLIEILRIYKVDCTLISFLEKIMKKWKTTLNIKTKNEFIRTSPIKIKRGIFQGDSLSALWFCIALNPLSNMLNKTKYGYKITGQQTHQISHLLYVDDIKLYASSKHQLTYLLKTTETFSQDINMSFGTEKCKINCILKGQHGTQQPYTTEKDEIIESLGIKDTYKYLGYKQKRGIEHTKTKEELTEKFKERLKKILTKELSGRNKTKAINTYAIPVLTYSFGILNWNDTELENLNTIIRTNLNKYRMHHIRSATQRVSLSRKEGGRGIIDIKNAHYEQIEKLRTYFLKKAETSPLHKAITTLNTSGTPLKLNDDAYNPKTKITSTEIKKEAWKQKTLHGKHAHALSQPHVDQHASNAWLTNGNIFGETEGLMIAIQDQVIKTRNYNKYIIKDRNTTTDTCRICTDQTETIDHIISGCKILAPTEYTNRHNNVAKIIHNDIAKKFKLTKHTPYYTYTPTNVLENNEVKLYWNRDITTDRTINHNRPDLTLTLKKSKITYLIEISIPNTTNLQRKEREKIEKYLPLAEEIKNMWHQDKVIIVPIILSATGVIPKSIHKHLEKINLHPRTYVSIQKSVILDTCSIVRKFLNVQ